MALASVDNRGQQRLKPASDRIDPAITIKDDMTPVNAQNRPDDERSVTSHVGTQRQAITPTETVIISSILAQLQTYTGHDLQHYDAHAETAYGMDFWQAISDLLADAQRYRAQATQLSVQTTVRQAAAHSQAEARPHAPEEQHASATDFRAMADMAPAMLWITDTTGYCTFLSRGWYEFTAQTEATGLDYGWTQAVHPEDQARARHSFLAANAVLEPFSVDYRLHHAQSSYRWVLDTGHPRFGTDGEFLGYIGSVIDITERKGAEEQLRRSEERYRYLFEAMDEGFCVIEMILDEQGQPIDYRFLEINPAFERFTGLQQAIGRTARELVPNLEAHWIEIYGKVARTGEPLRFEEGSEAMNRWFDVYTFPIGDKSSHRVAILFKNITERKRAVEALRILNSTLEQRVRDRTAQLERSNRELDQFAYVAAHDLKAPLRGIDHLATWIAEDVTDLLPEPSKEHLAKLRGRGRRMERLLDDLLAYSRVGRRDGTPEVVNPTALVKDIVALLAPPASFTVHVTGELPNLVTPRAPLESVLRNLIDNAIKHHHQPQHGEVYINAQDLGDFVEFCVRDNGPGIDPQFHERIFDVFQTLQPRDVNQGTTFYFTWPKAMSNA